MNISTPDLCDAHPDLVRVVAPMFNNYGGRKAFGGPIVTVKCFEDNSLVKQQVAENQATAGSWWSTAGDRCAAPSLEICWLPKPCKTSGLVSSSTGASGMWMRSPIWMSGFRH